MKKTSWKNNIVEKQPVVSGKKMQIFEVVLEDHSSLGGPMGSERVYEIGRSLFAEEEDAWKWIEGYVKKNLPMGVTLEEWNKMSRKQKKKSISDAGAYGIDIRKVWVY